jgi:tripartite-type tricarboxylate transporter receptor subunit TctC
MTWRALVLILCTVAGQAFAQPFPAKPVRIVVPWPPGGVTDVLTRAVALQMSEGLGQQVVIENRPGAGGTIGIAAVAKAPPDGYTLVMTDVPSHAISASLYTKLPYDPEKDFEAIAMAAGSPMVLATHPAMLRRPMSRPRKTERAASKP